MTPVPSRTAPAQSNRPASPRSVSGSMTMATTIAARHSGACTRKITRHPTASTSGPPRTTPSTGEPAVTKLHHPSAVNRSSASNMRLIWAIAAGAVADPKPADNVRNRMSDPASHAKAVAMAKTAAPRRPMTNSRL